MSALIIAPGLNPALEALNRHNPASLLPLVDRPFIQHLVEFVIEGGTTRFEFVISHLPEKMEKFLEDGSRWGSQFVFHLAQDPFHPYEPLKSMEFPAEQYLLLAHGDRLPQIDLQQAVEASTGNPSAPTFWFEPTGSEDPSPAWTGWAWIPGQFLQDLPSHLDEKGLEKHLLQLAEGNEIRIQVKKVLGVRSYKDLLASHRILLDKKFPTLPLSAAEADQGIWLSRNVSLHPTTRLFPPVYIGENCRIGSAIVLGPHAVIGSGCVLDSQCTVEDAVVFPDTFVGEGLELKDVLVDKNRLINIRHNTAVTISETFILGGVSASDLGFHLRTAVSRLTAIGLLFLLWPFLLLTPILLRLLRRGPAIFRKEAVRLPTQSDDAFWKPFSLISFMPFENPPVRKKDEPAFRNLRHFFLRFLPGLLAVAGGSLHFVGVQPRTREEIAALNSDWKDLYLKSKAGLITEAYMNYGNDPSTDECFTSEVFYASTTGLGHDFMLFFNYLGRLFKRHP